MRGNENLLYLSLLFRFVLSVYYYILPPNLSVLFFSFLCFLSMTSYDITRLGMEIAGSVRGFSHHLCQKVLNGLGSRSWSRFRFWGLFSFLFVSFPHWKTNRRSGTEWEWEWEWKWDALSVASGALPFLFGFALLTFISRYLSHGWDIPFHIDSG